MFFINFIIPLVLIIILVLPGVILTHLLLGRRSLTESFFAGGLAGLVGLIYVMRLLPLGWLPVVLGAIYALAVGLAIARLRKKKDARTDWKTAIPAFSVAVVIYFLWRFTELFGDLPAGMDSMYHVLIVGKMLLTGHIPENLLPYESVAVNYPGGSHLLVAIMSWLWSDMPPHIAFKAAYGPLAFFTAGMLFLLGKRLYDDWRGALLGALMWAMLAKYGGVDHMSWGGLPNLMAMSLLACVIWVAVSLEGMRRIVLAGLFGAGVVLTEHYTAIIAFAVLSLIITTDRIYHGSTSKMGKELLMGALFTVILLPMTVFGGIWRLFTVDMALTDSFKFPEFFIPIQQIPLTLGLELFIAGALGVAFFIYNLRKPEDFIVPAWASACIAVLALFGYLYRAFSFGLYGEFYAAFIPSIFLMSLSYPLSVAAGYFLSDKAGHPQLRALMVAAGCAIYFIYNFWPITEFHFLTLNKVQVKQYMVYPLLLTLFTVVFLIETKSKSGVVALAAMLALIGLGGNANALTAGRKIKTAIHINELNDFKALKNTLPADALLINRAVLPRNKRLYGWLPYWTGLECAITPLPASEPRHDSSVVYKRERLVPAVQEQIGWAHLEGRPIVYIAPPYSSMEIHGFELFYKSMFRKVYIYDPAKH